MPLEMLKSILTTVLLTLAAFQALGMAQVAGHMRVLPVSKTRLVSWHRLGGIAALSLALVVAVLCLLGQGYAHYPPRVQAHAALGIVAILVLAAKVVVTNRFRTQLRYALPLGLAAGLFILGTFVASALWYFVQLTR